MPKQNKMRINRKSIRFWMITLLGLGAIVLIIFLLFMRHSYLSQNQILYDDRLKERQLVFDKFNELYSDSLESLAFDYTYWDEMVDFTKTGDPLFAEENLDTTFATYKSDALWVYKPTGKLLYKSTGLEDLEGELPEVLAGKSLSNIFSKSNLVHYYAKTKIGIFEVYGATIHPSADAERLTKPQGYFLTGRLLNEAFLDNLSKATTSIVKINEGQAIDMPTTPPSGLIYFTRPLNDLSGKPVGNFSIEYTATSIKQNIDSQNKLLALNFITYVILTITLGILLGRWVVIPLNRIYYSLEKNSIRPIENMKDSKNEFGQIVKLIISSFEQKTELEHQITERTKTQKELERKTQEAEHINSLMVGRELKMIELKQELSKLRPATKLTKKHNKS